MPVDFDQVHRPGYRSSSAPKGDLNGRRAVFHPVIVAVWVVQSDTTAVESRLAAPLATFAWHFTHKRRIRGWADSPLTKSSATLAPAMAARR